MLAKQSSDLRAMREAAALILGTAGHSLTWGMLTEDDRERCMRLSNLAERMIQVMNGEPVPALTLAHAKNM